MSKTKKNIYPSQLSYLAFEETILLPDGILPLHIQDPMDLVALEMALSQNRFIAVIQAKDKSTTQQILYKVGCLGQIVTFSEGANGSVFVLIKGIQRCVIENESKEKSPVPLLQVIYPIIPKEPKINVLSPMDREHLMGLLRDHVQEAGLTLNFEDLWQATDENLMTTLAMGSALKGPEKQAILESNSLKDRFEKVTAFLEMARIMKTNEGSTYLQ